MARIAQVSIDSLTSALMDRLDPLVPTMLLVDPLLGEPIPELVEASEICADIEDLNDARASAWRGEVFSVPLDVSIPVRSALHPYLVELAGLSPDTLGESVRIAIEERSRAMHKGIAPHRLGGWFQTAQPQRLVVQLAKLCRLRTQSGAGGKARYLRIADRRVFGWLRHVVGSAQIDARIPALQRGFWLDDTGALKQAGGAGGTSDAPLIVSVAEWGRLSLGDELHPVRARWLGIDPGASGDYEAVEWALEQARQTASRWPSRFVTSTDRQSWALMALLYGDLSPEAGIERLLRHGDPEYPEAPGQPPEPFHSLFAVACNVVEQNRLPRSKSSMLEQHP